MLHGGRTRAKESGGRSDRSGHGMLLGDRRGRFYRIERRGRLNEAGRGDVAVCDISAMTASGATSQKRQLADIVPPADLPAWLDGRKLDAVIHIGAISETTATDGDLVIETNFRLSLRLLDWCTAIAHAVHLCLLGRDLWRWRAGLCRRRRSTR